MEDVTAEEAAEWGELQRKRRGKEGTRKEREAAERRFLEAFCARTGVSLGS